VKLPLQWDREFSQGRKRPRSSQLGHIRSRTYDRAVAEKRTYLLMDLFAGCGGMTRGFVDSGRFKPIFAVEFEPDAAATYAANFGDDHVHALPIEEVEHFPAVDVLIGGPPCQGFSPLNRDGVGLERRALWREYLRALRESRKSIPGRDSARAELGRASVEHEASGLGSGANGSARPRPRQPVSASDHATRRSGFGSTGISSCSTSGPSRVQPSS
jgi:hypothetical protein